jgi:nucleotide-binding universal stress UspA family protein
MNKIQKILAPTDLSELSCLGLRYAMGAAREHGAEVIVYLVVPIGEDWFPSSEGMKPARDYTAREKVQLDKFLHEKFAPELNELKIRQTVEVGAAQSNIIDIAEREGVDLIVMATHGRTGLNHVLLGSVTEKVVARAPCPIVVVPRQKGATAAHAV